MDTYLKYLGRIEKPLMFETNQEYEENCRVGWQVLGGEANGCSIAWFKSDAKLGHSE